MRAAAYKAASAPVALLLAACVVAGCTSVPKQVIPSLSVDDTVQIEQLAIHSDFPLPEHHRLLDDLRLERHEVYGKLLLPASDEPIHVYLFENEARFQLFLKQTFPDFPTRRAFFVETDTRLAVYAHWGDRVAEDLRHEVAHGFLHSVVPTIPLWLDEGLAEYFEAPRGSGGFNRAHVELLTAEVHQRGWRPNIERLEQVATAGDMSQLDYAEAWGWAHLLLETVPARRELLQQYLLRLHQGTAGEPLSRSIRQKEPMAEHELTRHLYGLSQRL